MVSINHFCRSFVIFAALSVIAFRSRKLIFVSVTATSKSSILIFNSNEICADSLDCKVLIFDIGEVSELVLIFIESKTPSKMVILNQLEEEMELEISLL